MGKLRGVGSDGSNIFLNKCNVRIEQVSFSTKTLAYRLDYTVDPDIESYVTSYHWVQASISQLTSLDLTMSNLNSGLVQLQIVPRHDPLLHACRSQQRQNDQ